MHTLIPRKCFQSINDELELFPVIAILGPRQCGKSTLAREFLKTIPSAIFIDIQLPSDQNKLENAEYFFKTNHDRLICIDEIQIAPDLFPILRAVIDLDRRGGRFLILGSASKNLLQQSSETLAGRISYIYLTPFLFSEVKKIEKGNFNKLWFRGGFPDCFLVKNERLSHRWLENYLITYVERDIPALGIFINPQKMNRIMQYCAHLHGQCINWSKLAEFIGVSISTAKKYFEIIEGTFIIRFLLPYHSNSKKRLIKTPKIYIRDSGLLHYLLSIPDFNNLMGTPAFGVSWEGFVLEQILSSISSEWHASFYRTSNGTEIDLILEKGSRRVAIECKVSLHPKITKGFYSALKDLKIDDAWIICPIEGSYGLKPGVTISCITDMIQYLEC